MAVDGFRLTSEPPDSLDPAAPDSAESLAGSGAEGLTFTSRPDGWQGIYAIEDGEARQVVHHVDWKLWDPSWSPDGRTLAAVSNRFTSNLEIYLFYFGADGAPAGLRALTDYRGADNQPAWSPDGRQIAFVSDRTGEGDLYLVPSTGGDPVRLTRGASVSRPSWSPDGGRIAFSQEGDLRSVDPLTGVISVLSDAPGMGRVPRVVSRRWPHRLFRRRGARHPRPATGRGPPDHPRLLPRSVSVLVAGPGLHRLFFQSRRRFRYLFAGTGLGAHRPDHPCPRHMGPQGAGLESPDKRGFPPARDGAASP